jgi:acetolactate synthase regulatory subunit
MMQHQVAVQARFNPETLERVCVWCVIVVFRFAL